VAPGAAEAVLRDLEWLGLDWDGAPILQSSRLGTLNDAIERLQQKGIVYPCVCSRADVLSTQSAPHGDAEPRYPGTCRGRFRTLREAERATGRIAGLRFVVPPGVVHFDDALAGPQSSDVEAEVGDFLVARRGGAPAYQLAVAVDDATDGVTEVVRGADLRASTARQLLLKGALGLPQPRHWHVPLVVDREGRRLAKRASDRTLSDLRDRGVDARSVVAWASRTSGGPDERARPEAFLAEFRIDRVPHAAVIVDAATAETWLR